MRSEGEVSPLLNVLIKSYGALESSGFGGATKGNSNQSSRLNSCLVWRRLFRGTLEVKSWLTLRTCYFLDTIAVAKLQK